ncbi:hypothetical protein [Mesorhizobium amorphae]|uniref:hypothetical protein n=1 Tax=Mesorhizobium amorphae TaxID=71433 RepID=UPI001184E033|nr:hypothetical protein [Mesorhizobium amorphae]
MITYQDIKSGAEPAPVEQGGVSLVRYDAACRALAEAKSVDDVKDVRDRSEAMRAYAKQAKNKQLEVDAAEIRIRAERRLGELIAAQRETVGLSEGGRPAKTGSRAVPVSLPTLAEAGIDKHLADRARKLAAIPETEFTEIVSDWRGRVERENERVSINLLKSGERHVAQQKPGCQPVDDEGQQYNDLQNAWNCAVRPARMRFLIANDLQFLAKASEDNGAEAQTVGGQGMTGEASRPSVGGGTDEADRDAGSTPTCALTPRDDLTVGTNSNPQPKTPGDADKAEAVPPPTVSATPFKPLSKAEKIRLIRPHCQHPGTDLCGGSGRNHCHACKKLMDEAA